MLNVGVQMHSLEQEQKDNHIQSNTHTCILRTEVLMLYKNSTMPSWLKLYGVAHTMKLSACYLF